MNFSLIVDMLFDRWTSYGVIANHLIPELAYRGVPMYLHPWVGVSQWIHPDLKGIMRYPITWPFPRPEKNSLRRVIRMSDSKHSGDCYYNMLADTPPCAKSIPKLKAAPYVIVPAEGTKQFYINQLGFTDNVRVVHRGASFAYLKRPDAKVYTFLYVGYLHKVKGVDLICEAFEQAFPDEKDVRLILKGNDPDAAGPIRIPPEGNVLEAVKGDERVQIVRDNEPHEALVQFYYRADAFVYPYRCLGYSGGKAALEARKSGCVTIMPAIGDVKLWGTQKYLFNYREVQGEIPFQGFDWGLEWSLQYDVEEIAAKMRAAYEDRAKAPELKGWTWQDAADEMMKVLEEK